MRTRTLPSILLAASLALAACGDDGDASTTSPTEPSAASAGATTGPAEGQAATIAVATDAALGDHLVDGAGRTLYLFEKDDGTTTACTGDCATNWPPLVAEGTPTAGDGLDATQLSTADGIEPNQVTYHGHLLYYFAGDQAPGDTNGVGIPSWYAVNPAGDAIE
jgi:predicted lipoprotein with Yx(FWY)xxD motif